MSTEEPTDGATPESARGAADQSAEGARQVRRRRTPVWVAILAVIGAVALVVGVVAGGYLAFRVTETTVTKDETAASQSPFYAAPATVPPAPGSIIRSQPLEYSVVGGKGYRFVYTSTDSASRPVAVSGRIFLPETPAPSGGRKILAWAHGTVGLGDQCAPSRATSYVELGWLEPALQRGWVVVATDYAGLGMPGPSSYLVGGQEARDVVNSVRAARAFPAADASRDWIVYGASQGGHSALWTAHLAASIAPELNLRAVAAAVPAAELAVTMNEQWDKLVGWVIGADAMVSWQAAYPGRDFESALTSVGRSQAPALTEKCILGSGLQSLVLQQVTGPMFTANPLQNQAWAQTVRDETPPPPPKGMPMFLAQGEADTIVLAGSNAVLQNRWCAQGVTMASLWLPKVSHQDTSIVAGSAVVNWALARFAGEPAPNTCALGVPAPITELPVPAGIVGGPTATPAVSAAP